MRFSILVPSFRRPAMLRRNLEALAVLTRRADEILVALRPAEDPDGLKSFEDFQIAHPELPLRLVEVREAGIVPAENALLAAATGDVACFLDDDAVARPFWLEKLARHYEQDARVGGVGGPAIDVVDGKPVQKEARCRNRVIFPGLVLDQSTRHTDRCLGVDHFRGANMSLRLDLLRAAGGFDSQLLGDCFRFELDACMGVKEQGFRLVFDPEAEVDHHEAHRPGDRPRQAAATVYNNAANETYVFLKHWGCGPRGWLHLLYALSVGNFPCPGLAWALGGACARLFAPHNRHLLGLAGLIPAWKGRVQGWRMARAACRSRRERKVRAGGA